MSGHVLIAPDKFKASLTAPEVAKALASGISRLLPEVDLRRMPVADGGDGTVDAVLASAAGQYRRVSVQVTGPTGKPVHADIAVDGTTAVVELASASGLALLDPSARAPLTASTVGTGELIKAALDEGVRRIVLGVGGSASTDGGAGMLAALGARALDQHGRPVPPGGGALAEVCELDLAGLDPRLANTDIILAADVDNPLVGPRGAAHVYGRQKGADTEQVELLDAGLRRWARVVTAAGGRYVVGEPGAGAAGGVGFAALAVLRAQRRSGADTVLDLIDFDRELARARLVITGEGLLDEQTPHGKAPAGVAGRAAKLDVPVIAVSGHCVLTMRRLREMGISASYALSSIEADRAKCIHHARELLQHIGTELADAHLRSCRAQAKQTIH